MTRRLRSLATLLVALLTAATGSEAGRLTRESEDEAWQGSGLRRDVHVG